MPLIELNFKTVFFKNLSCFILQMINPASHQLSCLASATLAKCAFLCTVLAENLEHSHLAFRVGLFGLEMARPPASTKPLEVIFMVNYITFIGEVQGEQENKK